MLATLIENKVGMMVAGAAGGMTPFALQMMGAAPPVDNPLMQWVLSMAFAAASALGAGVGAVLGKALLAFMKGFLAERKRDAQLRLTDKDPSNDLAAKLELGAIAGGEEAIKEVEKKLGEKK